MTSHNSILIWARPDVSKCLEEIKSAIMRTVEVSRSLEEYTGHGGRSKGGGERENVTTFWASGPQRN